MASVCTYPKTDPMCSDPDTVGGGVSMEKTSGRVVTGSKR